MLDFLVRLISHGTTYAQRSDGHPIAVAAAVVIVEVLVREGMTTAPKVKQWLESEFPID